MFRREKTLMVPPEEVSPRVLKRFVDAMSYTTRMSRDGGLVGSKNGVDYYFDINSAQRFISISAYFELHLRGGHLDAFRRLNTFNSVQLVAKVVIHSSEEDPDNPTLRFITDMHYNHGLLVKNLIHRLHMFDMAVRSEHPVRPLMGV